MVREFTVCVLAVSVALVGCGRQKPQNIDVRNIVVDTSTATDDLDISDLLDLYNVEIVKLETRPDAHVSSDAKITIVGNDILIGDRTTKRVALFDRSGNFIRNIGRAGRGPGEYVQLGDFTVAGDSVFVLDYGQVKVVAYPIRDEGYREIVPEPDIYSIELFHGGSDRLYFVTNYATAEKKHPANLIEFDMKTGERKYHIPYDTDVEKNRSAWGLRQFASTDATGETLVMYGHNDTIYRVSNGMVGPQYVMNFVRNRIPESLLSKDASIVLGEALDKGYTAGLDEIHNLSDYFLGMFAEGSTDVYNLLYDKTADKVSIGKSLRIVDMGQLLIDNFTTTPNDEFIAIYDVYALRMMWESVSKNEFANPAVKESIQKVVDSSEDYDNPILMIIKLKPAVAR